MTNNPHTPAPSLRMPRQVAGVNRHGSATGATTDGGVDPAILPLLAGAALPWLLAQQPVQDVLGSAWNTVSGGIGDAVSSIGDFFSGLFS